MCVKMNCIICFESSQDSIRCNGCQIVLCRPCCEQYLLSVKGDPSCPVGACKMWWHRDFLYEVMSRDFMREWIKKRQDDLYKREMPLMAATVALVSNHREADAKRQEAGKLREEIRNLMRLVQEKREEARRLEFQATTLESVKLTDLPSGVEIRSCRCFAGNCHGWLDAGLKCGICSKTFCGKCQTEAAAAEVHNHICDQGQVESVLFINASSRPCPTCSTLISKTEGCDQMYCIVCDTPFSWRTGVVENGIIHNPHYLRKMETSGYMPRMTMTDELPAWRDVAGLIPRNEELVRGFYALVYDLLQKQHNLFKPINNDYERTQLMINKMTETKFRSILQVKEKRWLLRRQIAKSTDVFLRVGSRLFWELLRNEVSLDELREKIEALRGQANTELLQVSHRWEHLCVPIYDSEFNVGRQKWRLVGDM
jgi:hypothetical protein